MDSKHYDVVSDGLSENAVIIVIGVGGGGSNAVQHMAMQGVRNVKLYCVNTDAQALRNSQVQNLIQIGAELTKGLGAGANPEIGKRAAQEDRMRIQEILAGADMVFITAGMGGGTGTGAAPIIAEIAKDMGILTVGVVTKPFPFEGRRRMTVADQGIAELSDRVDSLIIIPNEKLLSVLGKNISLLDAFKASNNVLLGAVEGIAKLITDPGLINVDFADVKTVMSEMGMAMMGTAIATGENRAAEAAEAAVASPLLEDISLAGAKGVLVNITAGMDMTIGEFEEVGEVVKSFTSDQATVVVGTVIDPEMSNEMRVTVVVTGLTRSTETGAPEPVRLSALNQSRASVPQQTVQSRFAKPTSNLKPQLRRATAQTPLHAPAAEMATETSHHEDHYLDIPAFLRRQAD